MRKKCCVLVAVIAMFSLPSFAQRAEVFGGYQFTHLESSLNLNGWNASGTLNFNRYLGATADFSGTYKSGFHFTTYTFGPTISAGKGPISPFAHLLIGGDRATATGGGVSVSDNGFVTMLGGGVDAGMRHGIAFRVIQWDWVINHFEGVTTRKNTRASAGIIVRF